MYHIVMDTPLLADNPLERARKHANVSLLGLANSTGIPRTTLRRKLEHPEDFTLTEWFRVCREVGFDPQRINSVVKSGRKAA